ncbi:MAG TPA: CHAT domain-containing tetratricopeptide repeat protein [Blastocatellia bacterium]|nr:CHAT domain-containing tetratricopeptide repeat protein [Blastocatellia bacterium]
MSFTFRVSFYLLALSLSLVNSPLAQPQSSSPVPGSPPSSAESAVRAVVEKYFVLYAAEDLDGVMSLWSRRSPDYAATKQALGKQFATQDVKVAHPTISRLKIEGERASLRLAVALTMADQQDKPPQRQALSLSLIREAGGWKVWRNASLFDELAAALDKTTTEEESAKLLTEEKELVEVKLVEALNRLGERKKTEGNYTQALRLAQVALQIAERLGDPSGKAAALRLQGNIHLNQGRYNQAMTLLQESLRLFEAADDKGGVASALNEIAVIHQWQGRNEEALEAYEQSKKLAEELGQREKVAIVSGNIGGIYSGEGRYDLALKYLREALGVFEELDLKLLIGVTLSRIGLIDLYQGRYAQALENFQRSLRIREELGNKQGIALMYNRIGLVYDDLGLSKLAMENFQKSLRLFEELGDSLNKAEVLLNIGHLHSNQGDYEQAVAYFQQSHTVFEELGVKGEAAKPLHNIGEIYRKQGRYELALETFEKCLRAHEEVHDKLGATITLKNIGLTQRARGSYAEALETTRRALALAREMNSPRELWRVQESMGRTLRALGQLEQSRQYYIEAIATIESLRHEFAGGAQQQQSFLEDKLSPWLGMIALLVSQQEYAEALTFAERSKARVLLDALQAGRASLRQSLSQRERQAEEEQRLRLVSLNSQLTGELRRDRPDSARVAELRASIEKARLEYEDFETGLYVAHPELKVQRGEAPIIKAAELAALLPDAASALLEYVVTDDETYLFAVTKAAGKAEAEVRVYTLPVKRDDLAKQTEAFRRRLAARDLGFRASAVKLYELLLKPAEAQLRGKAYLVIAPDAALWDLPFQALLTGANRFLIEDVAIAYAPSLTALREMTRRRKNQSADAASTTLLALGNPLLGKETINRAALTLRDGKLDPLPEAEQEVKALRRLYGMSRSKVYIGAQAREDRVKREAGQASILHFAAHGMLNNASPMYSHLALAPGGANEDGLLEAWELMRLDLKADLAVLSACETARGRVGAGEGMIGLSWAMFIAGVPSLVVSQWKVESAGTRDLMVDFHRALITGPEAGKGKPTKAEALRQAALKLMKKAETRHPFYWAGFVLVGDGR